MMKADALRAAWADLQAQWGANARLRMGLMAVVAILWGYGLLLMSDQTTALRGATESLGAELARVQPLAKERGWPQRADDARQQLTAVQGMQWTESDLGLVEARFQDWLRSTAVKTGLTVRDLAVLRAPSSAASGPGAAAQTIKARVLADHNRIALLGFLAELGRNEQVVVVDRMALRLASQPALVEFDLRILGRTVAAARPASGAQP